MAKHTTLIDLKKIILLFIHSFIVSFLLSLLHSFGSLVCWSVGRQPPIYLAKWFYFCCALTVWKRSAIPSPPLVHVFDCYPRCCSTRRLSQVALSNPTWRATKPVLVLTCCQLAECRQQTFCLLVVFMANINFEIKHKILTVYYSRVGICLLSFTIESLAQSAFILMLALV